jgi:hypothetical protein
MKCLFFGFGVLQNPKTKKQHLFTCVLFYFGELLEVITSFIQKEDTVVTDLCATP